MKKQNPPSTKAHVVRGTLYLLLLLPAFVIRLALGQQNATDSAIDATKSSFAVGHTTSGPAEAQPTPVVAATAVVVWDQYNNAGTAVTLSATFTDSPAMNSDLADDFDVEGYAWIVRWIDVDGAYFNGPGPANSFTVYFYADNDGFPATRSTPVSRRGSRTVARSGYMYAIVLLARASRSYFPANIGSRSKPT